MESPLYVSPTAHAPTPLTLTTPDTEIDWTAYMEQISQYVSGERDYTQIRGGTGPLVYPAFHVYIYTALYYLTDKGKDIFLAQQLFAALYLATLVVVMGCYWQAKVFTQHRTHGYGVRKDSQANITSDNRSRRTSSPS